VDHVLTVGEIYDKAIDLCLRNAGTIALLLGVYFLLFGTLAVLNTAYVGYGVYAAMHVHPREAILRGTWITVLIYVAHFTLLPVLNAAIFFLFDRMLNGHRAVLGSAFRSPIQRTVNIILASLFSSLIGYLALFTLVIAFVVGKGSSMSTVAIVVDIVLAGALVWIQSVLMLGVAIGLARVALDSGRVLPSISFGIAAAFSKVGRRRTIGVATPLLAILIVGTVGFSFAGIEAFALTGLDVANVVVRSIGNTITWSIWVAVATVYYRNLVPIGRPSI
jgi:hypothetical protein